MEVREVEITKKEKIYELTESEYKKLINESKDYGASKIKEYIIFCFNNYKYKINLGGIMEFNTDLAKFITDQNDYIQNTYNWSFWDWLEHNK